MTEIQKHIPTVQELIQVTADDPIAAAKLEMAEVLNKHYDTAVKSQDNKQIAELAVFIKDLSERLWTMSSWNSEHKSLWLATALGTNVPSAELELLLDRYERITESV
jgi:signal transduction histidine kinase